MNLASQSIPLGSANNRQRRNGKRNFRCCKYCYQSPLKHHNLCSACAQRSKEENQRLHLILIGFETLSGFLEQSNISKNNIKTIEQLLKISDDGLHLYASVVFEIGQRFPRKKKRFKRIAEQAPELYQRMKQSKRFHWCFEECDSDGFGFDDIDFDEYAYDAF